MLLYFGLQWNSRRSPVEKTSLRIKFLDINGADVSEPVTKASFLVYPIPR